MIPPWGWDGERSGLADASFGTIIASIATVVAGFWIWGGLTFVFQRIIVPNSSLIALQIALSIGTLLLGGMLYLLRCRSRGRYGIAECAIGVIGAIAVAGQLLPTGVEVPNATLPMISWLASLYVIVRGLDNCYEGLKSLRTRRLRDGLSPGAFIALWEWMFFGISAGQQKSEIVNSEKAA